MLEFRFELEEKAGKVEAEGRRSAVAHAMADRSAFTVTMADRPVVAAGMVAICMGVFGAALRDRWRIGGLTIAV